MLQGMQLEQNLVGCLPLLSIRCHFHVQPCRVSLRIVRTDVMLLTDFWKRFYFMLVAGDCDMG